ncbi:MAG: lipoyl domain-containing protein [Thermogemmata sp.]|jgi:pyruvate/2-oxoglutarate dehydrogenase complex dihydrolipoamide acyltransferase (E2) component|uniref:Biotin attachment protein n=1 Tax=Thermogemmata fonticola TaxID=2755323 RepID=A0A7V9AAA6_9BACT|nr:lipoyl domain-containing protein [Thermogemmata fonticola]MBA2224901.1 biotin attachment protein [Thermogemmata fonticola]
MYPEMVPIILPNLGTDRAVLSAWYVHPGETVYAGDRVAEVLIPGATVDIPAPIDGVLVERQAGVDQALFPGSVLGYLSPLAAEEGGPS